MWPERQQKRTEKGTTQIVKGLSDVDEIRRGNVKKKLQSRNWNESSKKGGYQEDKAECEGIIYLNYAADRLFRLGLFGRNCASFGNPRHTS